MYHDFQSLNTNNKCRKNNTFLNNKQLSHPTQKGALTHMESRGAVVSFWQKNMHKYWLAT